MLKKGLKIVVVIIILAVIIISICLVLALNYDPPIDPNVSFTNLKDVQAVLSDDFYFFDFDVQKLQAETYNAITDTYSLRKRKENDFEYIGYEIYYVEAPFPQDTYNAPSLFVTAISGKNLDGLADELRRNLDSSITDEQIIIDGIECLCIYRSNRIEQLYFMIGNVRYCFKTSIQETEFLSICESAIAGRYQNI
jgi:hypothetical protein